MNAKPGRTKKSEDKFRQAQEALLSSENFYWAVFENIRTAAVILEEDGTILLANGEFEKLTGYTKEEVEGKKKWTEFVHQKDDLERMKEYHRLRRIDPLSVPHTYEFQFVDRKGRVKDIAVTVGMMPGMKQSLVTLLDIGDRKLMEAALAESEKRLADIIDFLPDATFAIDLSGKIIAWNRALEEMSGEKAADMLGIELVEANKALQKEISERKRAEAVLKDNEKKFAATFFKSPIPMAITALKDGRYIDVNESFTNVMGLRREELVGNSSTGTGYITSESRALFLEEYRQKGFVENLELPMQVKDGELRCGLFNSSKITIGCEDFFLTMVTDITELRRVEEELRKYREDLEVLVSERTSELESRTKKLKEVNTALKVLLQKREEDKKILEESFVANIGNLVLPYVGMIRKNKLDVQQQFCLDIIENNLGDITSPLLKNIRQFDLTDREIQIASLIKDGKPTKEIAKILGIAKGSIDTHRKNIRKKLGLDRTLNLQSHLCFLEK